MGAVNLNQKGLCWSKKKQLSAAEKKIKMLICVEEELLAFVLQ